MTYSRQRGQGLVELIIAISVITVGMFAVWSLALSSYTAEREAQLRFTGANLAREGVEVVKNIRDSNWLAVDENEDCLDGDPCRWSSNLAPDDYVIDDFLTAGFAPKLLKVRGGMADDATRIYQQADGGFFVGDPDGNSQTPFRRMVTIRAICCIDKDPNNIPNRQCDNLDASNQDWSPKPTGESCNPADGEMQIGLDVTTRVTWLYNDQVRESIVQDQLFNWR